MSIVFIITRHVNSEQSNELWQENIRCIRRWYPTDPILIIDDHSNHPAVLSNLYQRRFESAPQRGASFKSVTGNLVEELSAERIEFFNGINIFDIRKTRKVCIQEKSKP